jgi:4'-phosphopantetheinyl transferase
MPSTLFSPPPLDLELKSDEIHVWRASLDQSVSQFYRLRETLSTDERMRAERFYFERDRKHFVAGRGILRTILGRYLNVEPDRLQFCYGKHGKPELSDAFGKRNVFFNMSDSEGLGLYAFTRSHEIGVDIERIREISDMDQIAESFFSLGESTVFCSIPNGKKKEAFFNCWTRKEAFIKAIGGGLSQPLDKFDVSLVPGESARLLRIEGDSKRASRWSIQELEPASGFVAALAVKKRSWQLRCWRWGTDCQD